MAPRAPIRTLIRDQLAVSAVISVILMVAVAVVLSATVFVLVNGVGQSGTGGVGPKISLTTDPTSSSSNWIIRVGDATQNSALPNYQIVLSTPTKGVISIKPETESFVAGQTFYADTTTATTSSRVDATTTAFAASQTGYRFVVTDQSGDSSFNTLDNIVVNYDSSTGANDFSANIIEGQYRLELRHIPSDTVSGAVNQLF